MTPVNSNTLNKKCGDGLSSNCVYSVYYLRDPITRIIRYVGYTGQDIKERLKEHCTIDKRYHKGNWIKSLIAQGHIPIIEEVEAHSSVEKAKEREIYYIGFWGRQDLKRGLLTNLTDGGTGGKGKTVTEEAKKKLSKERKGIKRPGEVVEKMRASKKGKLTGADNPFYGKMHSPETREKIKEARSRQVMRTGWKMTEEQKIKIIETRKRNKEAKRII